MPQGVEVQVLSHPPIHMPEVLSTENQLSFENGGRIFDIHRGVPEHLARQLIEKSRQKHIENWTPGDAEYRFTDTQSIERHIAKGRSMYLLAQGEDLAGTIWYGKKDFPSQEQSPQAPNQTFAIRIYEGYLGQGLAKPFMDLTLKEYLWSFMETPREDTFNGLWLSMDVDNPIAVFYLKYGYQMVAQPDGRIFMVLSEGKIREIAGA